MWKTPWEASVFGAFEDMEYEDGRWDFDSDLMNLEDGVYLSVYDKNSQELLYGRIPLWICLMTFPLKAGTCGRLPRGKRLLRFGFGTYGQRPAGTDPRVISISDAERDFRYTLRLALILSP